MLRSLQVYLKASWAKFENLAEIASGPYLLNTNGISHENS